MWSDDLRVILSLGTFGPAMTMGQAAPGDVARDRLERIHSEWKNEASEKRCLWLVGAIVKTRTPTYVRWSRVASPMIS